MSGVLLMAALAQGRQPAPALKTSQVRIAKGIVEGVISADDKVRTFKGIPYAAPPVGPLRWQDPQPALSWSGVRRASEYGPRCMQGAIYPDMVFHDDGPKEDCLTLNLWMPAHPATPRLPVMVWIHGGGFNAGGSSEPRQDGGNLSKQGVLVVSMNYRLGIFGFFAHPDLAKQSAHHAAGNYGLLDQVAALRWVHENIAKFGGDPNNVTIFGQSAGSSSVSALVASPLAHDLFQRAIGESGAALNATRPVPALNQAEEASLRFGKETWNRESADQLRAKPAAEVLEAAVKAKDVRFSIDVDGYFLPSTPLEIYSAGRQAHVPLLAGWNGDEGSARAVFGDQEVSAANWPAAVRRLYPENAEEVLQLYPASDASQAKRASEELSRDRGVGSAMWAWLTLQKKTGNAVTYRYEFDRARPLPPGSTGDLTPRAFHSAEIEYVFSMLPKGATPWPAEDRALASLLSTYWANFAKSGNPNGAGLPDWPAYDAGPSPQVMYFNAESHAAPDKSAARFKVLTHIRARS